MDQPDRRVHDQLTTALIEELQKRSAPTWDVAGWLRFAIGGGIAGMVAWAGISGRIGSLEVRLTESDVRAGEDRQLLRQSVHDLSGEIRVLSDELTKEREDRIRETIRSGRRYSDDIPAFGPSQKR